MKRKLLFAALCVVSALGFKANAYQTPEANGIYYLYNTACTNGDPGFMSTGNGYGFQVVIDKFGFPVKLIDAGEGKFKFQFIHHEGYLADDGWMYSDGDASSRARVIEIQDQGSGNYKLYNTNNSTWIEDWYTNVVGDGTENRHNYIWQFLSKAERDAMVAGYTTSVKLAAATSMGMPASVDTESEFDEYLSTNYIALDQSSKIENGTFDTSHNTKGWSTTVIDSDHRTFTIGWGNEATKNTPEVYEGAGYLTHDQISVDKVGLYKVSANATYRCGNNNNNNRIGDLGYDGSVTYLQANNSIAKVDDWYSGKINGNGPSGPTDANNNYFSQGKYLTEVYVYVGEEKTIDISLHSHAFTWGGWLMFNNFKLTYYTDQVSDDDATAILETATSLEDEEMDADIKTALTAAKTTFNGNHSVANYNALQTAIDNAQASADAYALFAPERTKALALGMTSEAIAAVEPDVNALKVAEYTFVTTNYAYGVELGTWTKTNATDRRGQHWDGTTDGTTGTPYSEQDVGWDKDSWTCSYTQDLTLPAGSYVFKVAGRKSSNSATLELKVKNGESVIGTVNDFPNGDTGFGINTSGATDFSNESTYANANTGRGWEWRYVQFTLADPATVTVSVNASASGKYQWVGFCNPTVQTNDEDNVDLMEALVALNSAKAAATLTKNTTNVGSGVFQLNSTTNDARWTAYSDAKDDADDYELTSSSTASEVNALTTALNTAISNYNNQPLNAPAADKHYNIIVATAEHAKLGNAIVMDRVAEYPIYNGKYISNNTGFTLNASAAPQEHLAQACVFTPVAGKVNTYNITMERVEGSVYLTYGNLNDSQLNWKNDQIQATTESSKKGEFRIAPTTTANVFNIVNTNNDNLIGCEDAGNIYTTNNKADFTLAEASQASVPVQIQANKYGTIIFPFNPDVSDFDDITFYSCSAKGENTVEIEPLDSDPVANTPYVVRNASGTAFNQNVTGWGTAAEDSYTEGLLTGVYTETTVPENSYVLQTQDGVQSFYKVTSALTSTKYRAYLTVPSGAKSLRIVDGKVTEVIAPEVAETEEEEVLFNMAGIQVDKNFKGFVVNQKGEKRFNK